MEPPRDSRGERLTEVRARAGRLGGPLAAGVAEVFAIGREMLAIPAEIALGLAERLGLFVLAGWRLLRPLLEAGLALARRGLAVGERELTPARTLAGVIAAAAILLAVSQFADYREVRAGVPAYEDVETVAPAPQVSGSAENAGSAHAYLPILVSIATLALVAMAMRGRWRRARVLIFLGASVVAISVLVDVPQGLDEGDAAIQFEGAEAQLLGAFWVQLACGVVIAICGPLLAAALRPAREESGQRARRQRRGGARRRRALADSGMQGASS